MKRIGGNVTASFLSLAVRRNAIGEMECSYSKIAEHRGFLDYASGGAAYRDYDAKTSETTHIFLCDAFDIDRSRVSRIMIGERSFDVVSFDEPMELGYHFEIELKETRQDGG